MHNTNYIQCALNMYSSHTRLLVDTFVHVPYLSVVQFMMSHIKLLARG